MLIGTPNRAGYVQEVVDVILQVDGHSERTTFAAANLGKQNLILGFPWLEKHNPQIDWQT